MDWLLGTGFASLAKGLVCTLLGVEAARSIIDPKGIRTDNILQGNNNQNSGSGNGSTGTGSNPMPVMPDITMPADNTRITTPTFENFLR